MCNAAAEFRPRRVPAPGLVLGGVVLAALCTAPFRVKAQDTEEYRIKVERLAAHLEAVRAQVLAAESMPARIDTVVMGPLRLLVRPERRAFVAEVAARAWDSVSSELGTGTSLVPEHAVLMRFAGDERYRLPPEIGQYLVRYPGETEAVTPDLARFVMDVTWGRLDSALNQWIRSPSRYAPLTAIPAEVVYVELVTAPWQAVKRCHGGDVDACARVLGLETAADTASLWYTAEEQRRAIVGRGAGWWMDIRTSPDYIGCLDGDDTACATLLNRHLWMIGPPLSASARESILRVALEVGGDGALQRLARSEGRSVGDRLAEAAEVPRDSLIAVWRERILAAAPEQVVMTGSTGGAALLWVVLLVFLSMRSTRWREA
jgi:hypothetical protein